MGGSPLVAAYDAHDVRHARAYGHEIDDGVPSSAAKHAGESNRGKHSQSMEPSLATSAAVSQSPSSIRFGIVGFTSCMLDRERLRQKARAARLADPPATR